MERRPPLAKKSASLITLLKFGLVGLLNTGIDYGLFLLLAAAGVPYLFAHVCSYTAGLLNSFIWNKFWTFRATRRFSFGEAVRFLLVNLAALAAAGGVLALGMEVFRFPEFVSKALALPFSLGINYLGNRLWVFPPALVVPKSEMGENNKCNTH
jgi:putative flippase GtrA